MIGNVIGRSHCFPMGGNKVLAFRRNLHNTLGVVVVGGFVVVWLVSPETLMICELPAVGIGRDIQRRVTPGDFLSGTSHCQAAVVGPVAPSLPRKDQFQQRTGGKRTLR